MEKNTQFLLGIADLVVVLLVVLFGILAPLIRFRSLGKAAIIASLGFVLLGLAVMFDLAYHVWAAFVYVPGSSEIFEQFYWMRTILRGLCTVFGLVLLIVAIVARRPVQPVQG